MVAMTDKSLEKRSKGFRYLFFLVSNVRFKSYRSWSREGEPNPFTAKTYRRVQTARVEFDDILADMACRD